MGLVVHKSLQRQTALLFVLLCGCVCVGVCVGVDVRLFIEVGVRMLQCVTVCVIKDIHLIETLWLPG